MREIAGSNTLGASKQRHLMNPFRKVITSVRTLDKKVCQKRKNSAGVCLDEPTGPGMLQDKRVGH